MGISRDYTDTREYARVYILRAIKREIDRLDHKADKQVAQDIYKIVEDLKIS